MEDHLSYLKEGYNKFTVQAILTLVGAFLLMTINGALYAWGGLVTYITGYFREFDDSVD